MSVKQEKVRNEVRRMAFDLYPPGADRDRGDRQGQPGA